MKPLTVNYFELSKTELIEIIQTREAKKNEKYNCECGISTNKANKARHMRSDHHKAFEATHDQTTTKKGDTRDINKLSKTDLIECCRKSDIDAIIKKQAIQTKDYYCECGAKTLRKVLKTHLQTERHKAHEAKQH
jgi:hypothetical protein